MEITRRFTVKFTTCRRRRRNRAYEYILFLLHIITGVPRRLTTAARAVMRAIMFIVIVRMITYDDVCNIIDTHTHTHTHTYIYIIRVCESAAVNYSFCWLFFLFFVFSPRPTACITRGTQYAPATNTLTRHRLHIYILTRESIFYNYARGEERGVPAYATSNVPTYCRYSAPL